MYCNRATWTDSDRTDFYANEGRTQIVFQDINFDGKEEMLVYVRKLIYACAPTEIQELLEVETVKWAYLFQDGYFVEMENSEFTFDSNSKDAMKSKILQREGGKTDAYVITEQIAEDGRIYQVFL